jgi:hypothetical protein
MMPAGAFATETVSDRAATATIGPADVELREGGMLVGQVVDAQGVPQPNKPVAILYDGRHEVARTTTDENGVFAAQGLRGGQYQIVTADGTGYYRMWMNDTAPPAATDSLVLVADQSVVRGQWEMPGAQYGASWLNWVRSHPYITAGIVAAAVAIPLALADDDDGGPSS